MDESKFWAPLYAIIASERVGTVGEVEIDLRHELTAPDEWRTGLIGKFDAHKFFLIDRLSNPYLWFPWDGVFEKSLLVKEAEEAFADKTLVMTNIPDVHVDILTETNKSRFISLYVKNQTPEEIVKPGDKISIDYVESRPIGEIFDHIHDSEIRIAYLKITDRNFNIKRVTTPMIFRGKTRTVRRESAAAYFYMIERMCKHFKVKELFDIDEIGDDSASIAVSHAKQIRENSKLAWSIRPAKIWPPDDSIEEKLWKLTRNHGMAVNSAVLMGYHWAKAEAASSMKPLALSALKLKAAGSLGGKNSGLTRKRLRQQGWEMRAKQLAKTLREKYPTLSQEKLAYAVDDAWVDDHSRKGITTLKKLISEMEITAELPRRSRR